ncbi:MAG: hypothetical protein APF84_01600 [Gracilibacter sp. BRH_c7a]|nr:MAG: hypothetical protein APF84_01600 [Gracilibacter sp. BRH_c7a]
MNKIRGMVLRVEERQVVVVTEEGDYLKVKMPVRRPSPGETIEIPVKKPISFQPYYVAAAILIFFMVFGVLKPFATPPVFASVTLDMTPSVQLTIGKSNLVIQSQAQNPEGEKLLKELDLEGLDVYQAVNLMTSKAAEMNFFDSKSKNLALATIIPLREAPNETSIDKNKIMQVIHDEMYERKYDGYVVVNQASKEIIQQAEESGLPLNRYMLMQKYGEQGIEISPETLKDYSPSQIMQSNQMPLSKAFPGDWCEVSDPYWGVNGNMDMMRDKVVPPPSNTREDYSKQEDSPMYRDDFRSRQRWNDMCP